MRGRVDDPVTQFAAVRSEMRGEFAAVRSEIREVRGDIAATQRLIIQL